MALTKEYEYDCEVRGPYKAVHCSQGNHREGWCDEISRTYHRHVLNAAQSPATHGAIPTSLARTHLYRQCATPCGLAQSSLRMRPFQTHKQLSNGEQPWH